MQTALYYPHTHIENKNLIKQALFLWDQLEYICPLKSMRKVNRDQWKEIDEILIRPLIPDKKMKKKAHQIIVELADSNLPDWFLFDSDSKEKYGIYPQKLLPETWRLLRDSRLVSKERSTHYGDYIMSSSFGLTIMAILADVCAGKFKRTITDRESSYASLNRYWANSMGADSYSMDHGDYTTVDRLVTVSFELLDIKSIPLKKLLKLRKKEFGSNGQYYRSLRLNYLEKIDTYVDKIQNEASHQGDVDELVRVFQNEIADDYEELAEALELKMADIVLSKELGAAVVLSGGVLYEPITTSIIGFGALTRRIMRHQQEKKDVYKKHCSAWLYKATN